MERKVRDEGEDKVGERGSESLRECEGVKGRKRDGEQERKRDRGREGGRGEKEQGRWRIEMVRKSSSHISVVRNCGVERDYLVAHLRNEGRFPGDVVGDPSGRAELVGHFSVNGRSDTPTLFNKSFKGQASA